MSRLATPIRKNDNVLVITGKDRGKRGRVLKVLPDEEPPDRRRREPDQAPHEAEPAARTSRAASSSARRRCTRRNVQLVCPECGAQTRIGHKILGDGRKVRICRKCEGVVDK